MSGYREAQKYISTFGQWCQDRLLLGRGIAVFAEHLYGECGTLVFCPCTQYVCSR